MRGKPSAAKSLTGGEKSTLPLNHGLTVCWSVDATSIRWLAINDRKWLETISCTSCFSDEGRVCVTTNSSARQTAKAPDIAVVSQFQFQEERGETALSGEGNSDFIRCRNSAGAV